MRFMVDGVTVETGGPEDRLLPWEKVRDIAGISRTTAWRLQRTGQFPAPVPVSAGRVGWWESELTAWKRARGAAKPLRAPGRPRFAGMPRQTMNREGPSAPDTMFSPSPKPTTPSVAIGQGRKRASRPVAPGQIDFGF